MLKIGVGQLDSAGKLRCLSVTATPKLKRDKALALGGTGCLSAREQPTSYPGQRAAGSTLFYSRKKIRLR